MERRFIQVLSILALVSTVAIQADGSIRYRSESFNNSRKNAGMVGHTHLFDQESWYGTLNMMVGGGRSFRASQLAECLFGCAVNDCGRMLIQGSDVEDRSDNALLADYFYLPTDYSSSVSFDPHITNVFANFDFYIGFNKWCQNAYFRVYAPVVWTKWNLNACEDVCNPGENNHPCGYFTPGEMNRDLLLNRFADYAAGLSPESIASTIMIDDAQQDITTTFQGLNYARLTDCDDTTVALADLRMELGWNFLNEEDYLFGLYIAAAAPTGSRIHARQLFQPVVGNGHHWELGGGVNAKWIFWRCDDEERHFGLYLDATVTHLFKSREERTLDIAGKPLSRYMLLERLGTPIIGALANDVAPDGVNPSAQFKYEYAPVANLSTIDAQVSIGAQADVALWFNYSGRCFSWDIGYEFFGQSCAKISRDCSCSSTCCPSSCSSTCSPCGTSVVCNVNLCDANQENTWALKGDAQVYGFDTDRQAEEITCESAAIPLSATQNEATIYFGTNGTDLNNSGVDNREFAFGDNSVAGPDSDNRNPLYNSIDIDTQEQIYSSFDPIFVGCCDLDFCTTSRPISNKLWTHLNYTWERCDWRPYLGIGGEVEFGKTEDDDCGSGCGPCGTSNACNISCSDCTDCGVSQWALWLKGGASFN